MLQSEHFLLLSGARRDFNAWRSDNPTTVLELSGADLRTLDLVEGNLSHAILCASQFSGSNLAGCDFGGSDLREADLSLANLAGANLAGANLSRADLSGTILRDAQLHAAKIAAANLVDADLRGANLGESMLRGAILRKANLSGALLTHADFHEAILSCTTLCDVDLSEVKGLDTARHYGPSSVGLDTIARSRGKIPEAFLKGCGVPDHLIEYAISLATDPIQLCSCFISYSSKDEEFAQTLHADLQARGVRCWFSKQDIRAGRKIHEQIGSAIRRYDKLLLILSPHSMASEWVKTEIASARKRERLEKRQMLFPVRLVDYEALVSWEYFDADTGKDSAKEIREYFVLDFTDWKTDQGKYKRQFERLIRDLREQPQDVSTLRRNGVA